MTTIIKANGEHVKFNVNKLKKSLRRVGADNTLINKVVAEVLSCLRNGMCTHHIYQIAFKLLHKHSRMLGSKYHLKKAIMQLGLSGFPFERFVSELLKYEGYKNDVDKIVKGCCVDHEVDIIAKRENKTELIECKYHNRPGLTCDVKIPLYYSARFNDITKVYQKKADERLNGWLVTNTRFTGDAERYGECVGLTLISWDYPRQHSLKDRIENSGLYPITCIKNFTKAEIETLLAMNVVLCKTIMMAPDILTDIRIPELRKKSIIQQCRDLYHQERG